MIKDGTTSTVTVRNLIKFYTFTSKYFDLNKDKKGLRQCLSVQLTRKTFDKAYVPPKLLTMLLERDTEQNSFVMFPDLDNKVIYIFIFMCTKKFIK